MAKVGMYWGPGDGPVGDDAAQAIQATIGMVNGLIGDRAWYPRGDSNPALDSMDVIARHLEAGGNRDDGRGDVIESLGRSLAMWDGDRSSIKVTVAGTARTWKGLCLVKVHDDLLDPDIVPQDVLLQLVALWRAAWATWTSTALMKAGRTAGLPRSGPHFGWMTWIRHDRPDPFTGHEGTAIADGTLHRFAASPHELTSEVAAAALGR